jgi:hypothetical protein
MNTPPIIPVPPVIPKTPPAVPPNLPQRPRHSSETKASTKFIGGLFFIVVMLGVILNQINPDAYKSQPVEDPGKDAYYSAVAFCRTQLKAPDGARFSVPEMDANTGWRKASANTWEAFGYVDAQNGFGATVRENWSAEVNVRNGKTYLKKFTLGDQETTF